MAKKAITYHGIKYSSKTDLANHLGISPKVLDYRLKSPNYDNNNLLVNIKRKKILGQKYNHLTAISKVSGGRHSKWKFKCDCGKYVVAYLDNVRIGNKKSCGHVNSQISKERRMKFREKHSEIFDKQIDTIVKNAAKINHNHLTKRNKTGFVGISYTNYKTRNGLKDCYMASYMHNGKKSQKRCKTLQQAIEWRGKQEMKFQHKLQPAIIKWNQEHSNND